MTAAVPFLEIVVPLVVGLSVVASLSRRDDAELGTARRELAARLPRLVTGAVLATTLLWGVVAGRSASRWAEMQLLWLAPVTFWLGIAFLVTHRRTTRRRRPARTARSRVVRRLLGFALLFAGGIGISWFSALAPVQMLLLAPREVPWPTVTATLPVGERIELVLPALTSFHGRMTGWAWNRALLLVVGVLGCWIACRRTRPGGTDGAASPGQSPTGRRTTQLTLTLAAVTTVVSIGWPSTPSAWRLGWSEGRIDVPVETDDPDAGTLAISYLVHPARDTDEPEGMVVAAIGGPAAGSQSRSELLTALGDVARTHDVLVSDYRGFGRSTPVGCPGVDAGAAEETAVADCHDRLGALAGALSARHAADDLEAVRRHLDLDRWNVYGQSYGTFFAQTYARAYPTAVRSVVLDSALPLLATPDYTFMASQIPGTPGDRTWRDSVEQARNEGWDSPSVSDLATIQLFSAWPEIGEGRDAALHLPPERRREALATLGDELAAQLGAMRNDPLTSLPPPPAQGVYACNDYAMPFEHVGTPAAREASTRRYAQDRFTSNIAPFTWDEIDDALRAANGLQVHTFRYEACLYWNYTADDGAAPTQLPSVPMLVISGSEDSTTTPQMAADIADRWNAEILHVVGGDHFVLLDDANSCARAATAEFLADPEAYRPTACSTTG